MHFYELTSSFRVFHLNEVVRNVVREDADAE